MKSFILKSTLITIIVTSFFTLTGGSCNNTTTTTGEPTTPVSGSRIDLLAPTSPQFPPNISLTIKTSFTDNTPKNVEIVIFNTDLGRVIYDAIQLQVPAYAYTPVTINLGQITNPDLLGVYNGKHRVFCYVNNNPSEISSAQDFQIGNSMVATTTNNGTNWQCFNSPRTYRLYYAHQVGFDAIAESEYNTVVNNNTEVDNTFKLSAGITINKTNRTNALANDPLTLGTGQTPGGVIIQYISTKISTSDYNSTLFDGLLLSVDRMVNYSGEITGGMTITSPANAFNDYSYNKYAVIFTGLINDRQNIDKPKAKTGSIFHEIGHQMVTSNHKMNYYSGRYVTPEDDYNHISCCVLQSIWPGSCGFSYYAFCKTHVCYIGNSKWR